MFKTRKIIEIEEEKCNGCGQCVTVCAESALTLVNGKARLLSEVYCDGLGACIGDCPTGALRIVERRAEDFDEAAVKKHQHEPPPARPAEASESAGPKGKLPCGCPSSQATALKVGRPAAGCAPVGNSYSELTHWPIKLQLLNPQAPFLKGADLLLLADCTAAAYPDLHRRLLRGKAVAMGCPKLDDLDAHIQRLSEILKTASLNSLTVVHMEVPCCHGFMFAAKRAIEQAGEHILLKQIIISRTGEMREG